MRRPGNDRSRFEWIRGWARKLIEKRQGDADDQKMVELGEEDKS